MSKVTFAPPCLQEYAGNALLHRVVLTGGPCGGKSTALAQMRTHFEQKGFTVLCAPEAATLLFTAGASKRSPPPSPPPEATPLGWRGQPSMLSSWHVRTYAGPDPQWGPSFCLSTESDEDAGARYRTRDGHPAAVPAHRNLQAPSRG